MKGRVRGKTGNGIEDVDLMDGRTFLDRKGLEEAVPDDESTRIRHHRVSLGHGTGQSTQPECGHVMMSPSKATGWPTG